MGRKLRLYALRLQLMLVRDARTRHAIEIRIALLEGRL